MKKITPKMLAEKLEDTKSINENTKKLKELLGIATMTAAVACDKASTNEIALATAMFLDMSGIKAPEFEAQTAKSQQRQKANTPENAPENKPEKDALRLTPRHTREAIHHVEMSREATVQETLDAIRAFSETSKTWRAMVFDEHGEFYLIANGRENKSSLPKVPETLDKTVYDIQLSKYADHLDWAVFFKK